MKAPTRLVSEYHSIITIAATVTLPAYGRQITHQTENFTPTNSSLNLLGIRTQVLH